MTSKLCASVCSLAEQMSFLWHHQLFVCPFTLNLSNKYTKPSWCNMSLFLLELINAIVVEMYENKKKITNIIQIQMQTYYSCYGLFNKTCFIKYFILSDDNRSRPKLLFDLIVIIIIIILIIGWRLSKLGYQLQYSNFYDYIVKCLVKIRVRK
jgi:hypothetical protein